MPESKSDVPEVAVTMISGGKRKRTGKLREEMKRAAIEQAKLEQENQDGSEKESATIEAIQTGTAINEVEDVSNEVTTKTDSEAVSAQPNKATVNFDMIATRIPQALKTLHPIFKQAKTFETQRLIKKVKFLRTKSDTEDEIKDLENQLKLLTHIQTSSLAQTSLLLKVRKHPLVKSSHLPIPMEITSLLTPTSQPSSTPSTSTTPEMMVKVENRLCSSKTVSDGIRPVLSWVIGENGAALISRSVGKLRKKAAEEGRKGMEEARKARLRLIEEARGLEGIDDEEGEDEDDDEKMDEGVSLNGRHRDVEDLGSDVDSGDDIGKEAMAAEAAGWESGSVDGEFDESGGEDNDFSDEVDDNDSHSSSSSSSSAAQPDAKRNKMGKPVPGPKRSKEQMEPRAKSQTQPQPKAKVKAKPLPRAPPTSGSVINSSTFLPTLATGFTRGGDSDSDPDLEFDPDGITGSSKAERKNRRGQRARQAIWEKKYGKNAKHVQKAQSAELNAARGGGSGWTKRDDSKNGDPTSTTLATKTPLPPQKFDVTLPPSRAGGTDSTRGARGGAPPFSRGGGTVGRGRGGSTASAVATSFGRPPFDGFAKPNPSSSAASTGFGSGGGSKSSPSSFTTNSGAALHPSWEAARLRRQKEMGIASGGGGGAAPKATKIVFD